MLLIWKRKVGSLILLLPGVGWDIMGYKSDPLPSYPKLMNCSYSLKLITPPPRLLLRFIYCTLIPPLHQPARHQNMLHICANLIYRAASHPLQYGCLPPLDVHPDWPEPRDFHCIHYRWVLPLYACPAFRRHLRDPLRRPMVEPCQDLDHIPGHHTTLATI